MLTLHAVVVQHVVVWLPITSAMGQRHMAGRHDGHARSCSVAALQIALAEQRQLSAATCSSRSLCACEHGWVLNFGARVLSLSGFFCAWALAYGRVLSVCVGCVCGTGYGRGYGTQERVKVGVH